MAPAARGGNGAPTPGELGRNQAAILESIIALHSKLDGISDHINDMVRIDDQHQFKLTQLEMEITVLRESIEKMRLEEIKPLRDKYEGITAGGFKTVLGALIAIALAFLGAWIKAKYG